MTNVIVVYIDGMPKKHLITNETTLNSIMRDRMYVNVSFVAYSNVDQALSPRVAHPYFYHYNTVLMAYVTDFSTFRIQLPGITAIPDTQYDRPLIGIASLISMFVIYVITMPEGMRYMTLSTRQRILVVKSPRINNETLVQMLANKARILPEALTISADMTEATVSTLPAYKDVFVILRGHGFWGTYILPRDNVLEAIREITTLVANYYLANIKGELKKIMDPLVRYSLSKSSDGRSSSTPVPPLYSVYIDDKRRFMMLERDVTVAELIRTLNLHSGLTVWTRTFDKLEHGVKYRHLAEGNVIFVALEPSLNGWVPYVKNMTWERVYNDEWNKPLVTLCDNRRYADMNEISFQTGDEKSVMLNHWAVNMVVEAQVRMNMSVLTSIVAKQQDLPMHNIQITQQGDNMDIEYSEPECPARIMCLVRRLDSLVPIMVEGSVMKQPPGEFSRWLVEQFKM